MTCKVCGSPCQGPRCKECNRDRHRDDAAGGDLDDPDTEADTDEEGDDGE